jgi:anti-anti-sigma regulatory factor
VNEPVLPLGLGDHACCVYADDEELCRVAARFVADGVAARQRVLCVANGQMGQLRAALGPFGPERLIDQGVLELLVVDEVYGDGPVDAETQLRTFAQAVVRAQTDGFTGLRVLADNTPLLVDGPQASRSYLRWESMCEPFIASRRLIGLCCFDRRRVSGELVRDLACMHRKTFDDAADASFRLIRVDDRLTLRGEVDWFDAERLSRLLEGSVDTDERVVLDLGEASFLDHHALLRLAAARDAMRSQRRTLQITGAPSVTRLLAERLGLEL